MTEIFAHRGASAYAPENTLKAFSMAIEQGAEGIELDVQMSRDGHLVVAHDETLDRVTGTKGWLKDCTLAELKAMSFDNGMEEYRGIQIPTLQEVLELADVHGIEVNIELKTGIYWYPQIEEKTVELVQKMQMTDRVIYSSFNHYSVQKIKQLDPQAQLAYLYSDVMLDVETYAKESGVYALHPAVYHVKMADFAEKYKASGCKVRVWTVNEPEYMRELIQQDWEAIITNYPDVALNIRQQLKR